MLDFINKGIAKVFGTKSARDLKEVTPYVEKINTVFNTLSNISDDQLRGKTDELRNTINEHLKKIDTQLADLHKEIDQNNTLDISAKEEIFNQIDKLESDRDEELEVVLLELLPTAFAVVKETARRLAENKQLEVEATIWDRELSAKNLMLKLKVIRLYGIIDGMLQEHP